MQAYIPPVPVSPDLGAGLEIAHLLVSRYCAADGLLAREVDCRAGTIVDDTPLVDELGDFAQYVCLAGMRSGQTKYVDWAVEQALASFEACRDEHNLIYLHRRPENRRKVRFFSTVRIGDGIWGLAELYRLTSNEQVRKVFEALVDGISRLATKNGMPVYGTVVSKHWTYAIPLSEPMTTGYLCEALIEHAANTKDDQYFTLARGMLKAWFDDAESQNSGVYFLRKLHGLARYAKGPLDLQFRMRGRPGLNENILTKGDVFLLFAALSAWRHSRDNRIEVLLRKWVEFIAENMVADDDRFFNHFNKKTGRCWSTALEENHSTMELLIDIAFDLGDERALELAEGSVRAWRRRVSSIGLYANRDSSCVAELDPIVDLSINMLKLAELTGNADYRQWADDAWRALTEHFRVPFGYAQRVDSVTAQPGVAATETKFLGLLLKGFLVRDHIANGGRLMESRESRLLACDR